MYFKNYTNNRYYLNNIITIVDSVNTFIDPFSLEGKQGTHLKYTKTTK